jgi:hypothetical protein
MDETEALLQLDERLTELQNKKKYNLRHLSDLGILIIHAAKSPDGYAGLVWKYAGDILDLARKARMDSDVLFNSFGWQAIANALESAVIHHEILKAFVFAEYDSFWEGKNLLPPRPEIEHMLTEIEPLIPTSFISPSTLAASSSNVQRQFIDFLEIVLRYPVDPEVKLQWGACALRALPQTSPLRVSAAMHFIHILIDSGIPVTTYSVFRALAEQHEELWLSKSMLIVLQKYIETFLDNASIGTQELGDLCLDDELLRRCNADRDLLVVLGTLGIYLVDRKCNEGEAICWRFLNSIQSEFPILAHVLTDYLTSQKLPDLPEKTGAQLETQQRSFDESVKEVESSLRRRTYDGINLAVKIYQSNSQQFFHPFLKEIRRCPNEKSDLHDQIAALDPRRLIQENLYQKESMYPIEGKLLQKMISDNEMIIQKLLTASASCMALHELHHRLVARSREVFSAYAEFESFWSSLLPSSRSILEKLLPTLWQRLKEGLEITKEEAQLFNEAR